MPAPPPNRSLPSIERIVKPIAPTRYKYSYHAHDMTLWENESAARAQPPHVKINITYQRITFGLVD